MHLHNELWRVRLAVGLAGLVCLAALAQDRPFTIRRDVDMVVLHTTVVDRDGHLVTDLDEEHFRVKEDGVIQNLSLFRKEAVPVTVGLVLDNSGSMAVKREKMMAGAESFVQVFNQEDEFFVVNFNSEYYLELEGKDFTSSAKDVQTALGRTATRGSTAIYDAIRASLEHIQGGTRQKKVLLIISDGVDSASLSDFDAVYQQAQESNVGLYFLAVPCQSDDDKRDCRRARRELRKLADVTGGMAYFPQTLGEVQSLGYKIANDVRNQYVLAYRPPHDGRDGRYHRIEVEVKAPGRRKLEARHRPGYQAKPQESGSL